MKLLRTNFTEFLGLVTQTDPESDIVTYGTTGFYLDGTKQDPYGGDYNTIIRRIWGTASAGAAGFSGIKSYPTWIGYGEPPYGSESGTNHGKGIQHIPANLVSYTVYDLIYRRITPAYIACEMTPDLSNGIALSYHTASNCLGQMTDNNFHQPIILLGIEDGNHHNISFTLGRSYMPGTAVPDYNKLILRVVYKPDNYDGTVNGGQPVVLNLKEFNCLDYFIKQQSSVDNVNHGSHYHGGRASVFPVTFKFDPTTTDYTFGFYNDTITGSLTASATTYTGAANPLNSDPQPVLDIIQDSHITVGSPCHDGYINASPWVCIANLAVNDLTDDEDDEIPAFTLTQNIISHPSWQSTASQDIINTTGNVTTPENIFDAVTPSRTYIEGTGSLFIDLKTPTQMASLSGDEIDPKDRIFYVGDSPSTDVERISISLHSIFKQPYNLTSKVEVCIVNSDGHDVTDTVDIIPTINIHRNHIIHFDSKFGSNKFSMLDFQNGLKVKINIV
jgi:hypothetical protein